MYSAEQCHTFGGIQTIYNALTEKLGVETKLESPNEPEGINQRVTWEFRTMTFILYGYNSEQTPVVFLFRSSLKFNEIGRRRAAKAKIGF
jgi:hypothetical protein